MTMSGVRVEYSYALELEAMIFRRGTSKGISTWRHHSKFVVPILINRWKGRENELDPQSNRGRARGYGRGVRIEIEGKLWADEGPATEKGIICCSSEGILGTPDVARVCRIFKILRSLSVPSLSQTLRPWSWCVLSLQIRASPEKSTKNHCKDFLALESNRLINFLMIFMRDSEFICKIA